MSAKLRLLGVVALVSLMSWGCVAKPDVNLIRTYYSGEMGLGRDYQRKHVDLKVNPKSTAQNPDRNYALNWMRLGMVTLGDGYAPDHPNAAWNNLYDLLTQQDVNKGRQWGAVLLNEDTKIWKGEPFEQALAINFVAMNLATKGEWDNARVVASQSLFHLKAVKTTDDGKSLSTQDVVQDKNIAEATFEKPIDVETNFALGYIMTGLAARQQDIAVGESDHTEANENFQHAMALRPDLGGLIEELRTGSYNTVLVVGFGQGPQKIGTGMDKAIASFQPMTPSTGSPLVVSIGSNAYSYPEICDVNAMAQDHMWNNLQDMRKAKSYVGTALMAAGAGVAGYGAYSNSGNAAMIGAGMMLAGALMKASAHADTRYCELMPQRFYIVPAMISAPGSTLQLQVADAPQSSIILTDLSPPQGPTAQLRFIQLVSTSNSPKQATPQPPQWAMSGRVLYCNDYDPKAGSVALPYILGGDCVCSPTQEALDRYQRAGFLKDLTVEQLQELYTLEKIGLTVGDDNGTPALHVLEGGSSLVAPLPGTIGYARLFGQKHAPYKASSRQVRELQAQYNAILHPVPTAKSATAQ
ncbi:MAG: hypothetical protein GC164_10020 [Phycisphaera sp.]|nr:hypothetical protein [Phycisphaera sp.]